MVISEMTGSRPAGPFSREEYLARLARIQTEMAVQQIDALVLTERANFEYVTGTGVAPLWSSFTRVLAVVVTLDGPPEVLVPGFIADEVVAVGAVIHGYPSLEQPPARELVELLRTRGLSDARIGIEQAAETRIGMPLIAVERLATELPAAEFVDGSAVMWAVRAVKTPAELERLRRACAANAVAFRTVFGVSREGQREDYVAGQIVIEALGSRIGAPGWTAAGWIAATSGPSSYHRFVGQPRPRTLEAGDMLWADLGMTVDGYWSDYCRAAVVGGPTVRQIDRQRRINEATANGVALARPGVAVADIARAVRKSLKELGLPAFGFGRLGHGIGLNSTEPPSVVDHDPTILTAGMVITVEPAAVYEDGLYCAEQVVVVGDSPEVISMSDVELSTI